MAAPAAQVRTPLRAQPSRSGVAMSMRVTIRGGQIFATRERMHPSTQASASQTLQCQDAGAFALDVAEAAGGELSGSARSASALHVHQRAPGQQ